MQDDVFVVGGQRHANLSVRVGLAQRVNVAQIKGLDNSRGQKIVQGRLAAFLPPGREHFRILHGELPGLRDGLHHAHMPQFVGGLKHGGGPGINQGENYKTNQQNRQTFVHDSGFPTDNRVTRVWRAHRPQLSDTSLPPGMPPFRQAPGCGCASRWPVRRHAPHAAGGLPQTPGRAIAARWADPRHQIRRAATGPESPLG